MNLFWNTKLSSEKKKITNYKITKRLQNDYLQDTNISSRGEQGESNRELDVQGGVEKYTMQLLTLWIIHQKGDEKKFRGYP